MHTLLLEKFKLFDVSLNSFFPLKWRKIKFASISCVFAAIFLATFAWYLFEIYYTFNLGYEIRRRGEVEKNLGTEYIKKQNLLIRANTPSAIMGTPFAKSMVEVSSIKYLKPKNFFVDAGRISP